MSWKKIISKENGCCITWLRERIKIDELFSKFCFCSTVEIVFFIEMLLVIKSEYILKLPKAKKSCFSFAETSSLNVWANSLRKEDNAQHLVGPERNRVYALSKTGKTDNGYRYRQQLINVNHAYLEQRSKWDPEHKRLILQHNNMPYYRNSTVQDTIGPLGSTTTHAVFPRPGSFLLLFVLTYG